MAETIAIVLAAGQGSRMRSAHAKVTHEVGGEPIIRLILRALSPLELAKVIVVVGVGADDVIRLAAAETGRPGGPSRLPVAFARQEERLGTAHALLCAASAVPAGFRGDILVVPGDAPLVTGGLLDRLLFLHQNRGVAATVLTTRLRDASGYGRVLRGEDGKVKAIREESDATDEERRITEVACSIYVFRAPPLFAALPAVKADNEQGEYYLTDVIPALLAAGHEVEAVLAEDADAVSGVNSRVQLAEADAALRDRVARGLLASGVSIPDPTGAHIGPLVSVGQDSVILPFTVLRGRTVIGRDCVVGPGSYLVDAEIGDRSRVFYSVVEESRVGAAVTVGPFAHLRPGTVVKDGARIGNFVETKNSTIGDRTKVPHHSYIGDATLGQDVNIGAGVVFVNYDGRSKHPSVVGDGAFVGCNANLIAPITVEPGAYVAAGSTITRNVPAGALGVARARQENLEGWVGRKRPPARKPREAKGGKPLGAE
jgi:bifunctional UDP-N-acetylglucosamine pyrophosphorylase/glucosamine-1-phosphate N-acetyltransferase